MASERIDDDRVRRVLLLLSAGEVPDSPDVAAVMPEEADRWLQLEVERDVLVELARAQGCTCEPDLSKGMDPCICCVATAMEAGRGE